MYTPNSGYVRSMSSFPEVREYHETKNPKALEKGALRQMGLVTPEGVAAIVEPMIPIINELNYRAYNAGNNARYSINSLRNWLVPFSPNHADKNMFAHQDDNPYWDPGEAVLQQNKTADQAFSKINRNPKGYIAYEVDKYGDKSINLKRTWENIHNNNLQWQAAVDMQRYHERARRFPGPLSTDYTNAPSKLPVSLRKPGSWDSALAYATSLTTDHGDSVPIAIGDREAIRRAASAWSGITRWGANKIDISPEMGWLTSFSALPKQNTLLPLSIKAVPSMKEYYTAGTLKHELLHRLARTIHDPSLFTVASDDYKDERAGCKHYGHLHVPGLPTAYAGNPVEYPRDMAGHQYNAMTNYGYRLQNAEDLKKYLNMYNVYNPDIAVFEDSIKDLDSDLQKSFMQRRDDAIRRSMKTGQPLGMDPEEERFLNDTEVLKQVRNQYAPATGMNKTAMAQEIIAKAYEKYMRRRARTNTVRER